MRQSQEKRPKKRKRCRKQGQRSKKNWCSKVLSDAAVLHRASQLRRIDDERLGRKADADSSLLTGGDFHIRSRRSPVKMPPHDRLILLSWPRYRFGVLGRSEEAPYEGLRLLRRHFSTRWGWKGLGIGLPAPKILSTIFLQIAGSITKLPNHLRRSHLRTDYTTRDSPLTPPMSRLYPKRAHALRHLHTLSSVCPRVCMRVHHLQAIASPRLLARRESLYQQDGHSISKTAELSLLRLVPSANELSAYAHNLLSSPPPPSSISPPHDTSFATPATASISQLLGRHIRSLLYSDTTPISSYHRPQSLSRRLPGHSPRGGVKGTARPGGINAAAEGRRREEREGVDFDEPLLSLARAFLLSLALETIAVSSPPWSSVDSRCSETRGRMGNGSGNGNSRGSWRWVVERTLVRCVRVDGDGADKGVDAGTGGWGSVGQASAVYSYHYPIHPVTAACLISRVPVRMCLVAIVPSFVYEGVGDEEETASRWGAGERVGGRQRGRMDVDGCDLDVDVSWKRGRGRDGYGGGAVEGEEERKIGRNSVEAEERVVDDERGRPRKWQDEEEKRVTYSLPP
ncbi:hypothetical protein R3P38DRAFT_2805599 [Favolaschia claudopus]|uniref:Uncharacterized protein n=1 Tax=Favolaschia claudopus TaxID=2862362 RepID=A0AAV9ZMQ8_9AGAR